MEGGCKGLREEEGGEKEVEKVKEMEEGGGRWREVERGEGRWSLSTGSALNCILHGEDQILSHINSGSPHSKSSGIVLDRILGK